MVRKSEMYLHKGERRIFKNQLTGMRDMYFEKISPIFEDPEGQAKQYEEKLLEETTEAIEDIYLLPFRRYLLIDAMEYRTLCMWLSCLRQVWEQQIFRYAEKEATKNSLLGLPKPKNSINGMKEYFLKFDVSFGKMPCWSKIEELGLLVNVLKHAEGQSADKLRKLRPDYFKIKNPIGIEDSLKCYNSALIERTLNITNDDFEKYYNSLIEFWDRIPEHMIER